jgi:peptidyl-prolyl cis-trans isomerase SurA
MNDILTLLKRVLVAALAAALLPAAAQGSAKTAPRTADYIAAVVNQELVTAVEVNQRIARLKEEARRTNQQLPNDDELRRQVLNALIEERVIVTHARDSGVRVDEPELDRAIASVAAQNQLTLPQLRERLKREGVDYAQFRANIRDQMLIERVREREVQSRIRITDGDIDAFLAKQRSAMVGEVEYNIAQVLVTVREGANEAEVASRRALAEAALARVRAGEAFDAVARQLSEDANKDKGGEIGLKPADRLPDVFVNVVRTLKAGDIAPELLKTGAGFHVLKLVDRRDGQAMKVTQTRTRHILLRPSAQAAADVAARRLNEFKRQIESGAKRFDELAREFSEDGSAPQGGDLGWQSAGSFVPEFEEAMNRLPVGGLSAPVISRFGVHLIQVLERRDVALDVKQLREQARAALREQKFENAFNEWVRDLRSRAYIELREPPA